MSDSNSTLLGGAMLNDTLLSRMRWGNANEIVYGFDTFLNTN